MLALVSNNPSLTVCEAFIKYYYYLIADSEY